ncbi:hypothetical protein OSB04_025487 [Centaurea solstitialis]|uniref:3'-5' exonuclease domain-containing protein n=1 Tax=Centaurea solstitialis TaxID=347529 RepID=A0AA38WBC3_9ASTR|nr:hypothetical protein OSB04_025487 [Centaurea solstitialis]
MTTIVDHQLPDDTHSLYDVRSQYNPTPISTIVTNTPSYVDSWISETEQTERHRLHRLIVGLDVKWRRNSSSSSDHHHPVATLQLCVDHRCLVFQILHSPAIPESLKDFLRNPSYTFCGVGVERQAERLNKDYDLVVGNAGEIRALVENRKAQLKELTLLVLGDELKRKKGVRVGGWDNQRLTLKQVEYACIDAFLSFEMGKSLICGYGNY